MSFRIDQLAVLNLATVGNSITAGSFVRSGGTSSQFLKADGTVDSSAYITGITSGMVTTALGYTPVPNTRNITINGVTQDLSVDRTWTISAGVSSVTGSGSGISVSPTTGAVVISNTGVTSNVAGTGISVSGATGAVTITNTGVTSIVAGTAITISGATGAVTINNAGVTSVNGSTGAITGVLTTSNYASTLDSIYLKGTTSPSTPGNFTLSIGNNGSYSYVQSHSSQPLYLNPVGNAVYIGSGNTVLHSGNYNSYAPTLTGGGASGTWSINITGNAGSETLATVTGRGASTSTAVSFNNVVSVTSASIGMDWWRDSGGTYMEFYGTSTATRVLRLQGQNGSGSYAQWYIDGGNNQIYGTIGGYTNFLANTNAVYLRYNGSDRFWTGSDGTRTQGWAYFQNTSQGLHWPGNNWHLHPASASDFIIRSGSNTDSALRFDTNGTTRGYVYSENDNTLGFLTNTRNWALRVYSDANIVTYGHYLTVGQGKPWSSILMHDSDEGTREIHCNSNRIGFLTQAGSWGAWLYDGADWEAASSVRAPIFYDSDNTAYYANFADTGTSINIAGSLNAATYNKPGLLLNASGTSSSGAAFGMQQITSEGWSGIFVDYEPYTGWGLYHDNPANYFLITSESSTGSFGGGFTVPSRVSGNRTAYVKHRLDQNNGDFIAGGNIYMTGGTLVATQSWVNSQGFATGGPFVPVSGGVNMTGSYGLNDSRLYLRTNGDTNHYLWNAADDWEELGAYAGTGFRVTSNNGADGLLYVYGSSNGGYTYSPYSFRAPIFYDSANTAYYADFASVSRLNNLALGNIYTQSYEGQLILGHTSYNFNFLNGSWAGSITAGILANCADEYEFAIHDSGNSVESLFIYAGGRILMGRDIGWGTTYIEAAESFRAPIFYDSANTAYYCDPASTSVLNTISSYTIYNTSLGSGYYFTAGSWGWRHQTPSGYIEFGPANGSYAHIYTDRGNFYFNVYDLYLNGYIVPMYGYNRGGDLYASRYYDANDTSYYLDPASESNLWRFTAASMTRNAINYLSINSPYSTRAGQSSHYLNGTMGWGTTDFNTIFSNWGSGFIDTWSSPGNAPGGSSHYVGIQGLHYNFQNSSQGYGFQMACAGEADNRFFWRSAWPNLRSWVEMIHSGNIGSQSVSYASSAGNADTVDGFHAAAFPYRSGGSSGYYQVADWMQFNTSAGLYWPSYNGAHIYPNTSTSYGSIRIDGTRSGWRGIVFDGSVNLMMNDNETGHYKVGYGWQWRWYQGTLYCSRGTYGGGTEYTVWDSGNLTNLNQLSNGPGYITSSSNVVGLYSSGFGNSNFTWYQSPTPLSPYTGSWASYLVSNHGDGATYYNQTIVMPFWGIPEYFRKEGGTNRGPYQFFTSEHGSTFTYATNMNQYVRTSDAPTFNGVYTNDWFRANGCTGLYFQTYGYGLRAPECEGNNYGNVCTYGGGRNGWAGYGITASFTMMGRSGTDVGLHDNGSSWIFYSPYGTQRLGFGTSTTSASYRIYVSGAIYATGDVVAYSDRRKKTDIVTIDNALEKVTNLRGVFYTKIGEEKKGRKTGVIAQEINEVLPEVVTYASDTDEYGVSYGNIAGVLIEAIKEQNELIKTLKSEIDQLKAKLE